MRRYSPVATPVTIGELASAGRAIFGGYGYMQRFIELFMETVRARHAFTVSSGRAALCVILRSLKRLSPRGDVIVPAYTCPSVAAAVVKAGLKVVICDIDKAGFGYDIDQLKRLIDDNTLAVICAHLFGIPTDVESIIALTKKRGVFVIEDMAQCAGVTHGAAAAIKGDAAFYSLGRGKNITAGAGGVIATDNDDLAKEAAMTLNDSPNAGMGGSLGAFFKMAAYFTFIRPSLYFIPENLPFLRLGETIYSTDFAIKPLTPVQSAMGVSMLKKLDVINKERIQKAKTYSEKLKDIPEIVLPAADSGAVYLRYPIIIKDRAKRSDIYGDLRGKGLGAATMYPEPLSRIEDLKPHLAKECKYPNAERMAEELLTLPTHHFVREDDIDQIVKVIREHLKNRGCNENRAV